MVNFKGLVGKILPTAKQSEDGRDQWPSRTAFLLASVGGAVGQGNIIRYPSQVFNNIGLQWFIPYLIAIFLLAIPTLILEVSIGQAYRGGTVVSFNAIHRRLKGIGIASMLVSATVVVYFAIILVYIVQYFAASFTSPLPWTGRVNEFYNQEILQQATPIPGNFSEDGSRVLSYTVYPDVSLIPEMVGWSAFIFFCVWLCMANGIGITGRAVYVTMALPIVMTIIIIGRGVSLENAGRGIKMYFAEFHGSQLAQGQIWQTACGQVFFSTGVGFGYYISYASYNQKWANAVQDACILVCSNCLFETIAAFGVFGVVGYLDINPLNTEQLGSFEIGFLTFPAAIVAMPGANFWAVFFFLTLLLLGLSSTYPMLDVTVTFIQDRWHEKIKRIYVTTGLIICAFLISLMYCTKAGYYILSGVDVWINNMTLVFVVWSECALSTSVYRYTDIVNEVGRPAYLIWNLGYFSSQFVGVGVGHAVSPGAGGGAGFAIFFGFAAIAVAMARAPTAKAPRFWGKNMIVSKIWFLAFYSGNQLRRDLNVIVGAGKNWKIPTFWGFLLRYISSPILAIVFSFGYPQFYGLRNDPPYIFGFILAHIVILSVLLGFSLPRYLDVFIPPGREHDGVKNLGANVTEGLLEARQAESLENSSGHGSDSDETKGKQ